MTEPQVCGHPTPSGPCTRKVLPGAGGCGYHPAPPDPVEQRRPEPMSACDCERPLVLGRPYEDLPPRCFLCTRPVAKLLESEGGAGPVERSFPPRKLPANGDDPVRAHNELLLALLGLSGEERDQ
jgi:hypothetical protein